MGALVGFVSTGLLVLLDASTLEYIQAERLHDPGDDPWCCLAAAVDPHRGQCELASTLWRVERRVLRAAIPERQPRSPFHVPAYNEPPAMVIATLDALSHLDYDNFEVRRARQQYSGCRGLAACRGAL